MPSARDFLIHEIQQNSDTTYRVFDWNRLGLDGKPRDLHVSESLASIDFNDFEPAMDTPDGDTLAAARISRPIANPCPPANPSAIRKRGSFPFYPWSMACWKAPAGRKFGKGQFLLLPRDAAPLKALENTTVLQVTLPQ